MSKFGMKCAVMGIISTQECYERIRRRAFEKFFQNTFREILQGQVEQSGDRNMFVLILGMNISF